MRREGVMGYDIDDTIVVRNGVWRDHDLGGNCSLESTPKKSFNTCITTVNDQHFPGHKSSVHGTQLYKGTRMSSYT
jgi:hypothetical protein